MLLYLTFMCVHCYNFKLYYWNKEWYLKTTNDSSFSAFLVAFAYHTLDMQRIWQLHKWAHVVCPLGKKCMFWTRFIDELNLFLLCVCGLVGHFCGHGFMCGQADGYQHTGRENTWNVFLIFSSVGIKLHMFQLSEFGPFQKAT